MDIYCNLDNLNQSCLPMWEYSYLLQGLESAYCICLPDRVSSKTQELFDSSFSASRTKLHTSGKFSEARDEHDCSDNRRNESLSNTESSTKDNEAQDGLSISKGTSVKDEGVTMDKKEVKKRASRSEKFDIKPELLKLKNRIKKHRSSGFTCSSKKSHNSDKYLGRRSKYIGVSKNSTNWQALINVNHTKKYIGTFMTELEAARTYDLYSLAMHGKRARLNFSYSTKEMTRIINYYLKHECVKS